MIKARKLGFTFIQTDDQRKAVPCNPNHQEAYLSLPFIVPGKIVSFLKTLAR